MKLKKFDVAHRWLLFLFILTPCWVRIPIAAAGEAETSATADQITQESGVYVLTDDNFKKFTLGYPIALVEFYAPWCGHCKQLEPEYSLAAKLLADKRADVVLAKLDATVNKKYAAEYDVKGYPTLKLFKHGTVMDYDGDRNADGIVQWLQEKTDPNYKPPPSYVLTLTSSNFSKIVSEADILLVEFYTPWCGHCKKLAPEYEKAAARLAKLSKTIPLAKVDATTERQLTLQYNVTGYPTLKIMRKGRDYEYNGPRDAEGIANYMIDQTKPAVQEIKSSKEADQVMSKDDVTIIGFFSQSDNTLDAYKDACEALRENFKNLYYTTSTDVRKYLKAKDGQVGIFYPEIFWSKFEPRVAFLDKADPTRKDIEQFIQEKCTSLVGHRTLQNQYSRYSKRPLVVAYFTVNFSHLHKEGTQFWRNKILNVAHKYPSYTFAISDEDEFSNELKEFGLEESSLDVNVISLDQKNKRYKFDPDVYDEFSEENFNEFMSELKAGRLKPHIKSQPLPAKDKGSVKTLVASNFEEIVNDESKDVLVEFYAPWCGHCKALAPIYEKLANKLKSDSNLIIAKFDATANDLLDAYSVEGFPTIYFAPSGQKQNPIKYSGGRTLDDMLKFLRENAVASFKKTEL